MPVYEYACEKCLKSWEDVLPISQRDTPLAQPCPHCKKRKCVRRGVSVCTMGVDAAKGPGADFKKLTDRIGRGVPQRYRENLDRAASLRGKKYGAQ